jgi:hypothetical protein
VQSRSDTENNGAGAIEAVAHRSRLNSLLSSRAVFPSPAATPAPVPRQRVRKGEDGHLVVRVRVVGAGVAGSDRGRVDTGSYVVSLSKRQSRGAGKKGSMLTHRALRSWRGADDRRGRGGCDDCGTGGHCGGVYSCSRYWDCRESDIQMRTWMENEDEGCWCMLLLCGAARGVECRAYACLLFPWCVT